MIGVKKADKNQRNNYNVSQSFSRNAYPQPDRTSSVPGDVILSQKFSVGFSFPIVFTRDAFAGDNSALAGIFKPEPGGKRKILLFVDSGVAESNPGLAAQAARKLAAFDRFDLVNPDGEIISGGEKAKDGLYVPQRVGELCACHRIDRQSYILAIGGGAMLDAVGLGASLVHRGVRLVRMPSTVLAQNDAGIGVKNGVNSCGQKNFLGCFAPPFAVVNDFALLDTLPDRQWLDGISEAVKVAAIKDAEFLSFLEKHCADIAARDAGLMEQLIIRCARLHVEHTGGSGDPFETGSARPLDFGHWSAHWLEVNSGNRLSHGEAVSIGIALDSAYAARTGFISDDDARRIIACLKSARLPVWDRLLDGKDARGEPAVLAGLDSFREHLGGELNITLPCPLGSKREIHAIDGEAFLAALDFLRAIS
jgi:3-dehydroquinate synthase